MVSIYKNGNKIMGENLTNIDSDKVKEIIDSERPITTFTNITQLGLSAGCSVEDIFLALPNNSYFECGTASGVDGYSTITNLPTTSTSTLLTIRKYTQARFNIEVKISSSEDVEPNEMYIGQLKGSDGTGLTWSRVISTTVPDVTDTIMTFSDETYYKPYADGKRNFYLVKNGICYVSIDVSVVSSTSSWTKLYSLPTPNISLGLIISVNTFDDTTSVKNLSLLIDKSGGLTFRSGENDSRYACTFSYPVAES